jgi:Cellulase (glycosyl hydrolase family 5)/Concanavalin A-like lectin/glucanases superfamily
MSTKKIIVKNDVLDSYSKIESIDSFNVNFLARRLLNDGRLLSDEEIDFVANILIQNGSKWVTLAAEAFDPQHLPYVKKFIQRLKAKGLKVHLRTGFSRQDRMKKADGTLDIFDSGSNFTKTEVANTATSGLSNSTGTLTDASKNWTPNEWKGYQVYCKSVTNKNLVIYITGNTANTLQLAYPIDIGETDSVFSRLGVDLIDTTRGYEISYQCANDNAFTNTTRGLYKHIADNARMGLEAGADSFGCSNEMVSNIQMFVPGSNFETFDKYIQEQKNLVQYIKTTVPGYPDGYTVSEIFWQTGSWINSGSIAPLDFLAYTCYEQESSMLHRLREVSLKFGADKIQLDEFSLNSARANTLDRKVAKDVQEYSHLINNRIKWAKKMGIRNIFRWELIDYSAYTPYTNDGGQPEFGYMYVKNQNILTATTTSWFQETYQRNICPYISNYSLHFSPKSKPIIVTNNTTLDLVNNFTIQCKVNTSSNENQTIIEKQGSYVLLIENKKIKLKVRIAGTEYVVTDSDDMNDNYGTDRWLNITATYDNSKLRLFINGQLKATTIATGNVDNSANDLKIGVMVNNNFSGSQARIQDIEISKECLYTAAYTDYLKIPNSTLAITRLATEQSTGTIVKDTSGINNNANFPAIVTEQPYWSLGIRDKIEDEAKESKFWQENCWTGYNIAGLEFSDNVVPGVVGQNYPGYVGRKYAKWCYDNGINAVRLPILLERLIPTAYGQVASAYSQIIKDFLKDCQDYGIKCFIDIHNYGFYNFGVDGKIAWGKTVGSSTYSVDLHKDFYQKIFTEFDSFASLEGYMYNEPRDLLVDTNPSNYKTTSTCRVFQQAALDKLRALGSTKWYGWTTDNWGGIHNIVPYKWGANFDLPWSDPLEKTFLDLHYYHDFYPNSGASHSGGFGADASAGVHRPFTRDEAIATINPVIIRLNQINETRKGNGFTPVPMNISEFGTPYTNTSNAIAGSDYMKTFEDVLAIFRANNVGFFYFAIGDWAPNNPQGLFASIKDTNGDLTVYDIRHETVDKYLNKTKLK